MIPAKIMPKVIPNNADFHIIIPNPPKIRYILYININIFKVNCKLITIEITLFKDGLRLV